MIRKKTRTAVEAAPAAPAPAGPAEAPVASDASRSVWTTLNRPFSVGFFLTLGGLIAFALGTAVTQLSTVLIYVAFAMFAALGLDPIVRFLEKRRLSRAWAIVVVYSGFALVLVGLVLLIAPTVIKQIASVIADIPDIINRFEASAVYSWLEQNFGDQVQTLVSDVEAFLTKPTNIATIGKGILQVGATIATTLSGIVIVLVLSLYFLASLPAIKKGVSRFAPARNRTRVGDMTEQITDSVGAYLMGMVVLAFCNAVVAFLLHLFLGLPFPLLMGVAAFCITLIPLVGSVLYWGVGTVLALFTGWLPALIFAAVYLIYMQLEAYVLTPRVMNRAISVPGALVVIGALVGGTLLGLLGALIAIPVTASILLVVKQVFLPRQDAKL